MLGCVAAETKTSSEVSSVHCPLGGKLSRGFSVRLQGTKKQRGRVSRPAREVGESYLGTGC